MPNLFECHQALAIAKKQAGPFYLYHQAAVQARIQSVQQALGHEIRLYYAVKANPNPRVLDFIQKSGVGADISSGGELALALKAGFDAGSMSFAGPGKSDTGLGTAVKNGIGSISIESLNELQRVETIAAKLNRTARVCLRVNPKKVFKEFAIKMGGRPSQFGVDEEEAPRFFQMLKSCPHCEYAGIHIYSGTQCLQPRALKDNFQNTLNIVQELTELSGLAPQSVNFGGGFGVPYHPGQEAFDHEPVAREMADSFARFKSDMNLPGLNGIVELGRFIMAEAGWYVARVVDRKVSRGKTYCILNGGMNHHLPASGNFGQVLRKNFGMINLSAPRAEEETVTFAGPLCTTIDIMAEKISIPRPEIGHWVAFLNSGAYAYSASPLGFLSHPAPAEILMTDSGETDIIREPFQPE